MVDVKSATASLIKYADAWEAVSRDGRTQLNDATNAILTLREYSSGLRSSEDSFLSGWSGAESALRSATESLSFLDAATRRLRKLLSGMEQELLRIRTLADAATEAAQDPGDPAPGFATLTIHRVEVMATELVQMHRRDLLVKVGIHEQLLWDGTTRRTLANGISEWMSQPEVSVPRSQFIREGWTTDSSLADAPERRRGSSSKKDRSSHQASNSPAGSKKVIDFLLS